MDENQVISALSAIAHETRLRILRHLVVKGEAGDSVGAIGDAVGAAPSKMTFHLSALERATLVTSERVSRKIVYRVDFAQMGAVIGYLLQDCCANNAEVLACCGVATNRC